MTDAEYRRFLLDSAFQVTGRDIQPRQIVIRNPDTGNKVTVTREEYAVRHGFTVPAEENP